ncbi:MAG: hypothetical protein PF541_18160 [Prolixibacteraceae bacterium]|jgi:hypothetical protein|nr:hypothetical protein [Prolixibacteraceae bacterium]
MKQKWPIFVGVILVTIGIILKYTINFNPWSLLILLTGVAFKIVYITSKIITKEYKPGFEIALLLIGLTFFMGGIVLHKNELIENPAVLKIIGISLKVLFVLIFIKKSRNQEK